MNILGISCYYHDSAACLIKDGKVVAAVQEERFNRKKIVLTFLLVQLIIVFRPEKLVLGILIMLHFMKNHILNFQGLLLTILSPSLFLI